ncbi:pleckstrin y domain containing, G (with RhoGef domain) member, partial [Cichlidogyrus casuarinus]
MSCLVPPLNAVECHKLAKEIRWEYILLDFNLKVPLRKPRRATFANPFAAKNSSESLSEYSLMCRGHSSGDVLSNVNLSGRCLHERGLSNSTPLFQLQTPSEMGQDNIGNLSHCLEHFSTKGLPKPFSEVIYSSLFDSSASKPIPQDQLISIKPKVEDSITNYEALSMKEKRQQAAIWELVETESSYLKHLKAIIDVSGQVKMLLDNIPMTVFFEIKKDFLPEADPALIFSNLEHVYAANLLLWMQSFRPLIDKIQRTGGVIDPSPLKPGFMELGNIFRPYKRFCIDQSRCRTYTQKLEQENAGFNTYLSWCNGYDKETRESLLDLMAKPFQRLTKYRGILESIRKNCNEESHLADLDTM